MAQTTAMAHAQHPCALLPQHIVDKVYARRGRLHAFPSINPATTALVVIDLDIGTGRDKPHVQTVAQTVNLLAALVRSSGGTVAWVTTPIQKATANFRAVFGDQATDRYEQMGRAGGKATQLWPELNPMSTDVHATKQGHSAFFPGKSTLHEQLQAKGVTSIIIVGAVTNVCCEASARDAAELHYQVTMVSDALIGQSADLDQATLTTFFRCYGDVRPAQDVVQLMLVAKQGRTG